MGRKAKYTTLEQKREAQTERDRLRKLDPEKYAWKKRRDREHYQKKEEQRKLQRPNNSSTRLAAIEVEVNNGGSQISCYGLTLEQIIKYEEHVSSMGRIEHMFIDLTMDDDGGAVSEGEPLIEEQSKSDEEDSLLEEPFSTEEFVDDDDDDDDDYSRMKFSYPLTNDDQKD